MATIRHSATLGIGARLAPSWSASVGAVTSGTSKIKDEVKRLKSASHETSSALKDMLASGNYYGKSAESVRRLRGEHERLTAALAHEQHRLESLKAWQELDAGGRASAALGRIGSGLATVGKTAALAAGAVGVAGAGAVVAFTKSAIEATSKLETMQTSLETLEGSPEKAKKSLDWITKFAAETPYKLEEVGEAYTRLRAYGIDPTNGSLRTLGDTAGSLGKPIMSAVEALADAVTGENERLKEFGIRASVAGNKITYFYKNAAGQDVRKSVSKTSQSVIASTLQAIWNEKYAGGMAKQSRTWSGLMSTLEDQWMLFQVRVMRSSVFDTLKNRLTSFADTVATWAEDGTLDRWAARIGEAYTYAFDKIGEGFEWVRDHWPEIKITMVEAWAETKKVVDVGVKVVSWLTDAAGGAGNLAIAIGALGAAKTMAPLFSLVKVGADIVAWMLRASTLAPAITGAATAASGAGLGGAAAAAPLPVRGLTVGLTAAAAGGAALGVWARTKYDANYALSDEERAQRAEDHKDNVRDAAERVRLLRAGRAADAEAARLAESEGLVVQKAEPKPLDNREYARLLSLGKHSEAAAWSAAERSGSPMAEPKREASEALPTRGHEPNPVIVQPPKPLAPAQLLQPKRDAARGVPEPAALPNPLELAQPPQAKREASAAPAARGAAILEPKPQIVVLPQPEPRPLDRAAPENVQQSRPAVAPAEVRTVTLPQPSAAVTNVHQYDQRKIDVHVDAKGADADEVARLLERKLQSERLASYE
jgi:hypothetical protein